jgi:DNA invertase Pin-like site-specific DNA recombinase
MIRAAIYARISYDPDARAVGVDRQREDCLRLAASRGWTVVAEYIDNNVSASKYSRKARTQCLRLLDDIEAGRIDAVAIWMEDRLQRQVLELAEFLKVCDGAGVTRIASIGGEFDLSDSEQRTMLYIKAAMAEAEVEKLRRRVLRQRLQSSAERRASWRRTAGVRVPWCWQERDHRRAGRARARADPRCGSPHALGPVIERRCDRVA